MRSFLTGYVGHILVAALALDLFVACGSDKHSASSGGESGSNTGGSGGNEASGGSHATGGDAGSGGEGANGSGGSEASGGSHATGGSGAEGGAQGDGGSGGSQASGGSGGTGATGGSESSGGSGGTGATGGSENSGGTGGSGGSGAEGGQAGSPGEEDCGCLDQEVTWGNYGVALINYRDHGTLSDCNSFELRRDYILTQAPDRFCSAELSECTEQIGIPDVLDALADPDVQDALSMSPVQYGFRATDAGYHLIQVGDATLEFAEPCEGRENCNDPPAGVAALRALLANLLAEQRASQTCASILNQ